MIDSDLGWCKSWSGNKFQCSVSDKLSCEPEERLLEVVVGLGRDVVVLEILLSVESDCLCLDLALLYVDLVSA